MILLPLVSNTKNKLKLVKNVYIFKLFTFYIEDEKEVK